VVAFELWIWALVDFVGGGDFAAGGVDVDDTPFEVAGFFDLADEGVGISRGLCSVMTPAEAMTATCWSAEPLVLVDVRLFFPSMRWHQTDSEGEN